MPFSETLLRLARLLTSLEHADGLKPVQWEAMRFLARANRFSNTPTALSQFLVSTKGTVSQTLNALARKGLIAKRADTRSARVVRLELTAAGLALLERDPLHQLAEAAAGWPSQERARLDQALADLLRSTQKRNGFKTFGVCRTCRHFRAGASGGAFCGLLAEPLSRADTEAICHEHASPA